MFTETSLPPTGIEISGRNYIKQGETINLQCNATMVDISSDNLEWLKDGRPLMGEVEQARVQIFTSVSLSSQLIGSISSTLEISQSRVGDSGMYVCRSTERSQLAGVSLEVKPGRCSSQLRFRGVRRAWKFSQVNVGVSHDLGRLGVGPGGVGLGG